MALELTSVKSISVAARLGSFANAAKELNITQPALSRRISEVEQALGVELFTRMARGVEPTPACLAFLQHGEMAIRHLQRGQEIAKSFADTHKNEIIISFQEVLCDDQLTSACVATEVQFDKCIMRYRSADISSQVSQDVLSGRAHFGLRYRNDDNILLDRLWLRDDQIIVVAAPSHPLSQIGSADITDLEFQTWVTYPAAIEQEASLSGSALALIQSKKINSNHVNSIHARAKLLEAGIGIALVRKESIIDQLENKKLIEIDTPINFKMQIFLIWAKSKIMSYHDEYFIEQLSKVT